MVDGILEHLNKNSLIHDIQHGFIKKRSCLTNLLHWSKSSTRHDILQFPDSMWQCTSQMINIESKSVGYYRFSF